MSKIESRLAIPVRYTRSIHILRDFASDHAGVRDYQATPLVLQTIERIMSGVQANSTARAFSLIGPYGSGKSAFGVFLAHYMQSDPTRRYQLVAEHSTEGTPKQFLYDGPKLLPVLVSGNNTSLRQAVLRGLHQTLEAQTTLRDGRLRVPRMVSTAADQGASDPEHVADLFVDAAALVAERTEWDGLILIIDELGQFLDYANRQPDDSDLFVLQTLAEMAARSDSTPCVVLTILHQAFDRYAHTAGAARRTELAKVQGRFAELPFQEPPIQMLRMVGRALCSEGDDQFLEMRQQWADETAEVAVRLGLRPPDVSDAEWHALIARAYPLHPTVLVALPLLFRQLAQNERSLFAFLTSPEPWSVQEFLQSALAESVDSLPIYRLPHLYAYVHATLGASLFGRARGQRWAELAEALAQLPEHEGVLPDVLMTIGVLGALGQNRGFRASRGQVVFALQGLYSEADVERALNELEARKHITYRQHRGSFVLWEGSDLDLDEMTQTARRDLGNRVTLVKLLQQHANTTPMVARRHSYQTGAVRYFMVRFVEPTELGASLPIPGNADGEVLYVVPADDEMLRTARSWTEHPDRATETRYIRIVVLPQRVRELRDLLLDVAALQQVLDTQPELENDRAARRELSSRLVEAQQMLTETISEGYGPHLSDWYWRGTKHDLSSPRQVDELLSRACDETYHATPRIWNELIVRRQPSTAASKARRNLIEAMLNHTHEHTLGLTGFPPERAIYESVFRESGIHRQVDGVWKFAAPPEHDPVKLRPVWQAIQQFLESTEGQARPVVELNEQLEAAPFGVKAGVIPLLFMAAYMANAGEVALYEHGNFVPVPDIATFERLLRQSHYFAVRRSRATGVRMAIYERLARALAPRALTKDIQPAVLDAVTPLLRLVSTLPQYTRTTRHISEQAQAIRQALLDARAPDELLFETLPQACGFPAFDPDQQVQDLLIEPFFVTLRGGLQELQEAYTKLVSQVRERIRSAFGASVVESLALRSELTNRYRAIAAITSNTHIRALGVRLENADEGDGWIESVAALVGRKPLDTWNDGDVVNFNAQIAELGREFRVAEQIAVTTQALPPDTPIVRVGIADGHGELSTVVHFTDRHPLMDQLLGELSAVLEQYDTLTTEQKTAVLVELLQPNLAESANGNGHYE